MQHPYPWQETMWQALQQRIAADRLPHALLLSGAAGLGKLDFAHLLARSLLCDSPVQGLPCGQCRGCQLLAAGTHPDFQAVQPEEEGKEITIGLIRDLLAWQALTPQYGRARVVIIEPADRMNLNAANALLKTLEEPGRDALLLLVTARPAALLPTIRSRCQPLPFAAQHGEAALAWLNQRLGDAAQAALALAISGGAPLRAAALVESGGMERRERLFTDFETVVTGRQEPVALVAQWLELPVQETLAALHGWWRGHGTTQGRGGGCPPGQPGSAPAFASPVRAGRLSPIAAPARTIAGGHASGARPSQCAAAAGGDAARLEQRERNSGTTRRTNEIRSPWSRRHPREPSRAYCL